ncbi:MAG: ABC transporter permease [Spirochaetaceae bacterium]|nr:ABC transporter permease [Spirochaetaceae bacterium]
MARRVLITAVTLFLVSVLTFGAFALIPGDPAVMMLGIEADAGQVESLRAELGLDRSLAVRYVSWLGNFLTGNLGNSLRFQGTPIAELVLDRLPVTFTLACISFLLTLLIALPTALASSFKEDSFFGRFVTCFTAVTIAVPGFFLGILCIWIFGVILRFFTPGGYVPYQEDFFGFLRYLLFPALAIAVPNSAVVIKFLRGSILQQLHSDYTRTAYSKGADSGAVLYRHVLRNAVIPVIALLGMIIGDIFSGSIVIEQVFTIPGIGRLLIASITSRDYPLAQTLVVYIAFIVVLANTAADVAIRLIDPRIKNG